MTTLFFSISVVLFFGSYYMFDIVDEVHRPSTISQFGVRTDKNGNSITADEEYNNIYWVICLGGGLDVSCWAIQVSSL